MGAEGAVNIIFRDALAAADDADAERARLVAEYEERVRQPVHRRGARLRRRRHQAVRDAAAADRGARRCSPTSATRTRERSMATSRSEAAAAGRLCAKTVARRDRRPPFGRVLVANRGEIARPDHPRLPRTRRWRRSPSTAMRTPTPSTSGWPTSPSGSGPPPPSESYLRIDAIVEAARATGAEAIHPGYGFLAERAAFARARRGRPGSSSSGRRRRRSTRSATSSHARRLGAIASASPVVPGRSSRRRSTDPTPVAAIVAEAERDRLPAAGQGRGRRRRPGHAPGRRRRPTCRRRWPPGRAEAAAAFGDGSVYLEREIEPARHIEVQLLGDATGRVVAIGERDCSLQRRHQKLVEEAPAPGLDRRASGATSTTLAVRVATAAGLRNAATAEFLRAPDGAFYFLEVNTRLQVEHGVTELVAGLDIVHEQFWLAAGRPLSRGGARGRRPRPPSPGGHAIEVRTQRRGPGARLRAGARAGSAAGSMPAGPGVRVDTGVEAGDRVPPEYDNLHGQGHGPRRRPRRPPSTACARALDETEIAGIQTTLPFHRFVARHDGLPRRATCRPTGSRSDWDGAADRAREAARAAGEAAGSRRCERRPAAAVRDGRRVPPPRVDPGRRRRRPDGRRRRPSPTAGRPLPGDDADRSVAAMTRLRARRGTAPSSAEVDPADDRPDRHRARRAPRRRAGRPPTAARGAPRSRSSSTAGASRSRSRTPAAPTCASGRRRGRARGDPPRPDRGPCHHPGTRRVGRAVTPGDAVAAGQRLLAVEAMKMQNELRAPRDGIVERVAVAAGQTVELGDVAAWSSVTAPDASDAPDRGGPDPARDRWRETLRAKARGGAPERRERVRDLSGIEIRDLYTAGRHRPASTRTATSGGPASTRSPGASSRRCTAAGSGRCASTPASRPPRRPTSASATSSSRARPGCRSPSTCRPRWATTRTRRRRRARSAGSACRSRASPTWRSCSTACRSARSAPR